jgi:hypothetical protein
VIPLHTLRLSYLPYVIIIIVMVPAWSPSLTATAQQQQQTPTTTGGIGAPATTTTTPLTPSPPLTPQEQQQQIRLQNVIASTTLYLEETEKQISGVVFTPRWSEPVWVNANSVAVLTAYCLPGEFADSGQEILGGFGLEVLESYGVALPQGFMVWMAVVGNEDIQNRRLPAALGVICASDLNRPETRVLSPQKQQEINNINQQFVNIQNTQINDIDNLINVINTVTTTTTTTTITPPPTTPGQNSTGGGAGTTTLAAAPVQQDTTPPTLIVPEDIVVEATSAEGAVVTYTVTAEDNVDGTFTLEADGITITRDNVTDYANMDGTISNTQEGIEQVNNAAQITCEQSLSGPLFPIGETTVQCTAKDSSGNEATQSFTVTVNPPPGQTPSQDNTGTGGSSTASPEAPPVIVDEEPSSPGVPLEIPSLQAPPVIVDEEPSSPQEPPAEEGEGDEGDEEGEGEGETSDE